jgi:hypothetical protein
MSEQNAETIPTDVGESYVKRGLRQIRRYRILKSIKADCGNDQPKADVPTKTAPVIPGLKVN